MKKLILIVLLLSLPMLAMSQNKAIEALADKYSDREGFSVITLQGKMTNVATKYLDMGEVEISSLMDNISSLIVISSDKPNEGFRADVRSAVALGDYCSMMTVSENGQSIKFLLSSVEEDRKDKQDKNEFVMIIFDKDEDTLISIVGNYKVKQVSKIN
jgi:hypothetical protein